MSRGCVRQSKIYISLSSFKFLNSCILFNIVLIDIKLNIFHNLNVLFLTILIWVECCLSHNTPTCTPAACLNMKLGNAGEGISGDMSTVIAECSFWMMIHQTGNLFALTTLRLACEQRLLELT